MHPNQITMMNNPTFFTIARDYENFAQEFPESSVRFEADATLDIAKVVPPGRSKFSQVFCS